MLKRVSIQNFKSLKDVTLDLQKVNLLIGPNNSGKTNFLKALEYVRDKYRDFPRSQDAEVTFNRNRLPISFLLTDDSDSPVQIEKTFDLNDGGNQTFRVSNGEIEFSNNGTVPVISGLRELEGLIADSKLYKPDPNALAKPGPVGLGTTIVNTDASNLIAFFDRMRDEYPKVFAQIKADLNKCVLEFTEINFQSVESNEILVKQFGPATYKRIGLTQGKQNTIYWADELSEGTLYFLALLCIINQPNPPKLLLLEEPEKGIHPRRIREVMDFIRRLVAEKDIQVIMTTHSPLLLDEFAESPEGVFVFDKENDGATTVRNLLRDVIEPANQENERLGIPPVPYTEALGEYWTIGFLGGVPHETA